MNRFLPVFLIGCSSLVYGNVKAIPVLHNKTTGQYIILINDCHTQEPHEYSGTDQAEALVRVIKSLPPATTAVFLEQPHATSSAFAKKIANKALSTPLSLGVLTRKLDQEEIHYESLDIRNDLLLPTELDCNHPDILRTYGTPMNCHEAIDLYEKNIDAAAHFFRCKKSDHHSSEVERYACLLLNFTRQQYNPWFNTIKSYSGNPTKSIIDSVINNYFFWQSWIQFDVIALQKIAENHDKKVIFIAAGTGHCQTIAGALQQKMGFSLEKPSLIANDMRTDWPVDDNFYEKLITQKPTDEEFLQHLRNSFSIMGTKMIASKGLEPEKITSYLQSFPWSTPKKDDAPAYPQAQHHYQSQKTSMSYLPCIATVCLGLVSKRRIFSRWWR